MKLRIPEQSEAASSAFPGQPRKVKKWLTELPTTNMGEMTRRIYTALRDLNRQKIPSKTRLEIMEMTRGSCRMIFNNLNKYFINRTLPLPEKSQKIVNLNQSMLQELSYGYKIMVSDAANGRDSKLDGKSQCIAIARSIRYMSEMLLRASEIYQPYPAATWSDIHQMYLYAESNSLQDIPVADEEYDANHASIADLYKQVLLFALARPISLRQSDSERVYYKLAEWAQMTKLGDSPQLNQVNRYFCARMQEDRPPSYLTEQDCNGETSVRTLDTSELVDAIRKQINSFTHDEKKIVVGDALSIETLRALAMSWGVCAKRRFSRTDRSVSIRAVIGLSNVATEMSQEGKASTELEEDETRITDFEELNFTLQTIPEDFYNSASDLKTGYVTHTELGKQSEDVWEMVARGRTLTESYDRSRKLLEAGQLKHKKADADLHWEVANVSAGGYCLRWSSDTTSRAQIGELIGLREREPDGKYKWRIGVIRWMQYTREHGLEIGVQILSPEVIPARVRRSHRTNEEPFDSLMLPGIRALKQPPTMLLPAHAFKTNDELNILAYDQVMNIKLGEIREHTGTFTQFQFTSKEVAKRTKMMEQKNVAEKNKNDFDELWSSL
jgi:cyclic-di-GMP-binding protein